MRLGTSKYMSMSRGRGAAHMAKGTREKCATLLKTKKKASTGKMKKLGVQSVGKGMRTCASAETTRNYQYRIEASGMTDPRSSAKTTRLIELKHSHVRSFV